MRPLMQKHTNTFLLIGIIFTYLISLILQIIVAQLELHITEYLSFYGIFILLHQLLEMCKTYLMSHYSTIKALEWEKQQWIKYDSLDQVSKEKDTVLSFNEKVIRASHVVSMKYAWGFNIVINTSSSLISLFYTILKNNQIYLLSCFIIINTIWYFFITKSRISKLTSTRTNNRKENATIKNLIFLYITRLHNSSKSTDIDNVISKKTLLYKNDANVSRMWSSTTAIQDFPNYVSFLLIPIFADKIHYYSMYCIFNHLLHTLSNAVNFFSQYETMENDMKALEEFWDNKIFNNKIDQYTIPPHIFIMTDISCKLYIKQGERIQIKGPSGSGKTTIVKKILGHLGGIKYSTNKPALSYTDDIAYMRQEVREHTPVCKPSIRQLFDDEKNNDIIIKCLTDVFLLGWFNDKIQSLDSPLENRISGGEKTRLCIALTLYMLNKKNCSWMILDEPEQGLDPELASDVLTRIFNTYPNVTIFIITHLCKCSIKKLGINKEWEIINSNLVSKRLIKNK